MKKTIISGTVVLAILAAIGGGLLITNPVSANSGQIGDWGGFNRPPWTEEKIEEIESNWEEKRPKMHTKWREINAALEAGDYEAWLEAVEPGSSMSDEITEENFPLFVEAHQKMWEAREIMEELGIEKDGFRKFRHKRRR